MTVTLGVVLIEGFFVINLIFILVASIRKYAKKRVTLIRKLIMFYLLNFLGFLSSFIGRFIVYTFSVDPFYTHPFAKITWILATIGILYIISFIERLFIGEQDVLTLISSVLIGFNSGIFLYHLSLYPIIEYGTFESSLLLYCQMYHLFTILICYGFFVNIILRALKVTKARVNRITAFVMLAHVFFMLTGVIFLILDVLYNPDVRGYIIHHYLSFGSFIVSANLSYMGYFQPKWFKKLIDRLFVKDRKNFNRVQEHTNDTS